jgi:aryl-alcohol dehydrogenase-like predicted oxidoreductase
MDRRKLGSQGFEVSAEGLGCMGMTHAYGAGDEQSGLETIDRAQERAQSNGKVRFGG